MKKILIIAYTLLVIVTSFSTRANCKSHNLFVTFFSDSIFLKNIVLNEKTVAAIKKTAPLNAQLQKKFSIKKLDDVSSNHFKYYVLDSLYTGNKIKILLIERKYVEENIIWLAVYDATNKLLDNEQVYYDNSEGFLSLETVIRNNIISVKTANEFAEKEADKIKTISYYISNKYKIVKK